MQNYSTVGNMKIGTKCAGKAEYLLVMLATVVSTMHDSDRAQNKLTFITLIYAKLYIVQLVIIQKLAQNVLAKNITTDMKHNMTQ